MRITIDTEKEVIIVPDTFYKQIDRRNEIIAKAGVTGTKIDYVDFIKKSFEAAINNPVIRKMDLKNSK